MDWEKVVNRLQRYKKSSLEKLKVVLSNVVKPGIFMNS